MKKTHGEERINRLKSWKEKRRNRVPAAGRSSTKKGGARAEGEGSA